MFSKATKLDSSIFFYNNSEVEKIRSYICLGFQFHASGSFTEAKQNIYNRSLKACFKFCKAFNDVKPNITTFLMFLLSYCKASYPIWKRNMGAFKTNMQQEKYLCLLTPKQRESLCKFRISSDDLEIER